MFIKCFQRSTKTSYAWSIERLKSILLSSYPSANMGKVVGFNCHLKSYSRPFLCGKVPPKTLSEHMQPCRFLQSIGSDRILCVGAFLFYCTAVLLLEHSARASGVLITHLYWAPWSLHNRQSKPVLLGRRDEKWPLATPGKVADLDPGPCLQKYWQVLYNHSRYAAKPKHSGVLRNSWLSFQNCNFRHRSLNFAQALQWCLNPLLDLSCSFLLQDLRDNCLSEALKQIGGREKKLE